MRIKPGQIYPVRVLQIGTHFYPQIYVKSFWHTGWYFIDMEEPDRFTGVLLKPAVYKSWNRTIEDCEEILLKLKKVIGGETEEVKIHNQRDEQF